MGCSFCINSTGCPYGAAVKNVCTPTTQLDLKRCSYGLLLTRHISAPYSLSHYKFSVLGF